MATWVTIDLLPPPEVQLIAIMIIILSPAEVPANLEQHLGREQQHDRLPHPHRHHVPLHEDQWTTSTPSSAIGQCYHHDRHHLHRCNQSHIPARRRTGQAGQRFAQSMRLVISKMFKMFKMFKIIGILTILNIIVNSCPQHVSLYRQE